MELLPQDYKMVPVDQLRPHPDNPRKGDLNVIEQLMESNGVYGAVVFQKSTGYILAGRHRWQVVKDGELEEVPAFELDVDDDHARRIMYGDNAASDAASYEQAMLLDGLKLMQATERGLDGTGWTDEQVDDLEALLDEDAWDPPPGDGGGEDDPGDAESFLPHISIRVPNYVFDAWREMLDTQDGPNDAAKLAAYLREHGFLTV